MFAQKNYVVGDTDLFDAHNYPEIVNELIGIKERLVHLPSYYKGDIVISFFKDHSIRRRWINENSQVVKEVSAGGLKGINIENLFSSCRSNQLFLRGYESFIKQSLL